MTKERAMQKVSEYNKQDIQEFLNKFGDKPEYDTKKVLVWLGY